MRIYLLLFFLLGVLFQSQAQTKNPAKINPDSVGNRDVEEEKIIEENIPDSMRVYMYAGVDPSFPGGDSVFYAFVRKNLIYPEDVKSKNITGSVYIKFIVEKDGSLSSISVIRGLYPSCDQAAIDVVSKSPKWIPGKTDGKFVRVQCVRRVKFDLN